MTDARAALSRMRVQNPTLPDDLGLFLVGKSTRKVDGGLQWSFDPLHKTFSPRPFEPGRFEALLASIETPALVVAGERGFRLADEKSRIGKIPNHRFVEIPEVGHMIHWFEPLALASALLEFVASDGA